MMHTKTLAFALAAFGLAGTARAAHTVDQSNTAPASEAFQALAAQPFGQEFTPTLGGLNFVDLDLTNKNNTVAGSLVTVDIVSGNITNGAVLGSASALIPAFYDDQGQVDTIFTFANTIALTPGQNYFLRISADQNSLFAAVSDAPNSDGRLFLKGTPDPVSNLRFIEGLDTSHLVTPEPATVAPFVLGGLALLGLARRAKAKKSA